MLIERNEKGHFIKSGNPGGRPKVIEGVRDLARQYKDDAIETLVTIAKNPKISASARVAAACAILDRGYGKCHQYTENVNMNGNLEDFLDHVAAETRKENGVNDFGYRSEIEEL